ncbi:hypothetical protein HanHA300_Chr05g0165251 [Helianthus annuus]|nr:hypothetical protein HanHA300_Chr05g0165251 [Helianthus annuus]KAJ0583670.1 hypothetical protein HanHA89_Chr05g0179301 [Helianthus annuus]KAJ0749399.1 hypothetical protein HanLR1_Chr05g0169381 [Helianthus annuus]
MFLKIITGTTGLLAASDSGQDGVGGRDKWSPLLALIRARAHNIHFNEFD